MRKRTMASGSLRKLGSLVALGALATGCVSVRSLEPLPLETREQGGIELRVFSSDDHRRAGTPSPRYVESVLERRDGSRWEPVFRSLDPVWRVEGLEPGAYRVVLPSILDTEGEPVPIEDATETVRVRKGQLSRVEANLDHVPRGAIAAGVVGAVLVTAVLHDWIDDFDLPEPPHELVDVAFQITVGTPWVVDEPYVPQGRRVVDRPPVVTSVFPEADALVAVSSLRVVLAFSEPLAAIEPDAIRVTGERAGPLAGWTTWDEDRWWLIWEPEEALPRGDELEIFLDPDGVRDFGGNGLHAPVVSRFRTTP